MLPESDPARIVRAEYYFGFLEPQLFAHADRPTHAYIE
jgi:hypothetical protein